MKCTHFATGCVSGNSADLLHKTAEMCRRLKCIKRKFFSTLLLRDEWIFCTFALAFWDASASVGFGSA